MRRTRTAASWRSRGPTRQGGRCATTAAVVNVRYKVFGDRVDGTYLAVDTTHAHINMPAAIMWARGFDDRALTLTFTQPSGVRRPWTVATQLHAGSTPLSVHRAEPAVPDGQPVEFGPIAMRQFAVDGRTFRFAAHHTGTDARARPLRHAT